MQLPTFEQLTALAMLVLFVAVTWRLIRRRGSIGPAASGTVHDMINEDKRKAIEIIVEERAEERRPENRDGNLPELERPKR
jgi:hypothetical protein